jgi:hypothetical protein
LKHFLNTMRFIFMERKESKQRDAREASPVKAKPVCIRRKKKKKMLKNDSLNLFILPL